MVRIFPILFILLWSSAFITTKPIVDNSDPFAALAFRFFFVALGFYLFCLYQQQSIIVNKRNLLDSLLSGVLFHGIYLGGVFYSISKGMPTGIAALIVTLQPILKTDLMPNVLLAKMMRWGSSNQIFYVFSIVSWLQVVMSIFIVYYLFTIVKRYDARL